MGLKGDIYLKLDWGRDKMGGWSKGWNWKERIMNFTPSWFTVCMGTGIIVQLLISFPYQAPWLRTLAYIFWVLDIILYIIFISWFILRFIWYPALFKNMLQNFNQSSYIGAIPVALDTITVGLITFYNEDKGYKSGVWVAYGMFWVSVAGTVMASLGVVFVSFVKQEKHKIEDITGVWLISFIPLIVTSATGSVLLQHLPYPNNIITLFTSFIMWSAGQSICFAVMVIYIWRLMSRHLPPREAIVSCFIPLSPLGQGAFSIQTQANFLSTFIRNTSFTPSTTTPGSIDVTPLPPLSTSNNLDAVAEVINWLGIFIALFMVGFATFWLAEAWASFFHRVPKSFNLGWWGFVFPMGTYCNGIVLLGKDLRNEGLKGFGAGLTIVVIGVWIICAGGTAYRGIWRGQLFHAPGLEGWDAHGEKRGSKDGDEERNGSELTFVNVNSERARLRH